ncbi:MAG: hypothetical protein ACLQBX_04225 [Candidatus Limnocylindrales bacterium]
MNPGKTTASLGLLALIGRGLATGFTKRFGQRYAIVQGMPADEDAILVRPSMAEDTCRVASGVHDFRQGASGGRRQDRAAPVARRGAIGRGPDPRPSDA